MSSGKNDRVRIISGTWKGRRIPILTNANIRPTGDRVKTTLFNWLNFDIADAHTLDLFAGTGALGLEALSRGAAHTTFVERDRRVVRQIQKVCLQLDIDTARIRIVNADAIVWLKSQRTNWDIVFVDPPFKELSYYKKILANVEPRLKEEGLVYVECSKRETIEIAGFEIWKQSTMGEVRTMLLRREY